MSVCHGDFSCVCCLKSTGNFFSFSISFHSCIYIYIHTYLCMFVHIYIYIYICVCVCVRFQFDVFIREYVWHKVKLMGYSMRLELTFCLKFEWLLLPYIFFLRVCFS